MKQRWTHIWISLSNVKTCCCSCLLLTIKWAEKGKGLRQSMRWLIEKITRTPDENNIRCINTYLTLLYCVGNSWVVWFWCMGVISLKWCITSVSCINTVSLLIFNNQCKGLKQLPESLPVNYIICCFFSSKMSLSHIYTDDKLVLIYGHPRIMTASNSASCFNQI